MFSSWEAVCHAAGDALLGWLLALPRDASLIILAMSTAAMSLVLRWRLSDQHTLRCMRVDRRRLAQRIAAARRDDQQESLLRYRRISARILRKQALVETRLALLTFVPLSAIVTWAAARIHYWPPNPGEPIEFVLYTPASAVGTVVHLVPSEDLEAPTGWIREVESSQRHGSPRGRAVWSLKSREAQVSRRLEVRIRSRTLTHPVMIGFNRYPPPDVLHEDEFESRLTLTPYQPFGWFPGIAGLAPWLTAYLIAVLAAFYAAKVVLGVS